LLHAYVNKPSKKLIFDLSQNAETVIRLVWRENIDDFSKIAIDDSKYYSESQFARDKGSRLFSSMVINLTNGQKKYLLEFDETDPVNPRNNLFEVIQQNRYFDLDYVKDKNEGFNYFLELDNKANERIKVDQELITVLENFFQLQREFAQFLKLKFDLSQDELNAQIRNFLRILVDVLVVEQRSQQVSFKSLAEKYSVGQGKGFKNRQTKLHDFLVSELLKISDKGQEQVDKRSQNEFRLALNADSSSQYDNPKKLHENSVDNQKAEIPQETIDNFKKLLDERLYELARQPSETLEAIENNKLGPIEFELLEKFLIDTNKPILRADSKKDHQQKLEALKNKLSCLGKLDGFVGVSFEKLEVAKSRLSQFYQNIIVGRSNEVQRIVYFKAADKNFYLDYTKLSDSSYAQLRELPWIKRLIFVIESNSELLSDLLDKPLPSKYLEIFDNESHDKFHFQINLGLLNPSLGKNINNDEIIVEFENKQDLSQMFTFSISSKIYLPKQPEFSTANQGEVPSFTQLVSYFKNSYWAALYDSEQRSNAQDSKFDGFWKKIEQGIKSAIATIEDSLK